MADDARLRLMFKAAQMFYESPGMHKNKIAKKMGLDAMQVTRFIREAREEGIVEIRVRAPRLEELQGKLRREFPGLREAVIVQGNLAGTAAKYFNDTVKDGMKIGIAGGNTLHSMVTTLEHQIRKIEIYPTQLIGRGPHIPEHRDPIVLITELLNKCGGRRNGSEGFYATIPPFEPGKRQAKPEKISQAIRAEHDVLLERRTISQVWKGMQEVNTFFISVGQLPLSEEEKRTSGRGILDLLKEMGVSEDWLKRQGIVGDISYGLFDENGTARDDWKFFLTLSVDHIRMAAASPTRKVVLIVGEGKDRALRAALKGGLCSVLITLDSVAERLLSTSQEQKRVEK